MTEEEQDDLQENTDSLEEKFDVLAKHITK